MSFIYYCPWCGQKIECAENDNGQYARCPCCDKTILVSKDPDADGLPKHQKQQESSFNIESNTILTFKCKECGQMIKQIVSSAGTVLECPACHRRFVVKPEDAEDISESVPDDHIAVTCNGKRELKEPLLTNLFHILGCLYGIGAFVSLVILVVKIDRDENIFLSACGVGTLVTCMMFSFGLAEFFKLIGEISHNSQQTAYTLDAIRKILEEKK